VTFTCDDDIGLRPLPESASDQRSHRRRRQRLATRSRSISYIRLVLTRVRRSVLPKGNRVRRLPAGIGRGLRMKIDFDAGQTGLYLGLYEIELNRYLRRLCRPGFRAYDIGGQVGYDALVIAKLTNAKVISLECDPLCCSEIRENAGVNPRYASAIQVREAYVSDRTDGVELSLDDLADETFVPDFMKMDIEGGEATALRGAERILSDRRPGLLVEVHSLDLERECISLLRRHGYEPSIVSPRRWLPDYRPVAHNRWLIAEGMRH
jgi:hypothetical protein